MSSQVAYLLLIVLAVFLHGLIAGAAWQFRRSAVARALAEMAACAACWSLLVGAMTLVEPTAARGLLAIKYVCIGLCNLALLRLADAHTGPSRLPGWLAPALVTVALAAGWLSYTDGLMLRSVSFTRLDGFTWVSAVTFGPVYWGFTAINYSVTLGALVMLLLAMLKGSRLARTQGALLAAGLCAPLATNVLLITGVAPRQYDPMPAGLLVSAAMLLWGVLGHRMLDVAPIARNVLVDALDDAILIVDDARVVVDVNHAMLRLTGMASGEWVGADALTPLALGADMRLLLQRALDHAPANPDERVVMPIGERSFEVRAIQVQRAPRPTSGWIVVLHDVTDESRSAAEQARLVSELQSAMTKVRTLTGLLPICSSCKQIRDERGDWHRLESYLRTRTDAEFSHGLCPDCVVTLYPGYADGT